MNYPGLSKRQSQIYDFIKEYLDIHKVPPSMREISAGVGLSSPSTVHVHLKVLEDKGYIVREGAKSRSMIVKDSPLEKSFESTSPAAGNSNHDKDTVALPLIGHVAAGTPILAEQNIQDTYYLPSNIFSNSSFLLKVQGDSMINIGIHNDDIVFVREQSSANNGDIVVAMIDGSATIKTYFQEADCVRLQPQNDAMEPIYSRDVVILGVVTGLFRSI